MSNMVTISEKLISMRERVIPNELLQVIEWIFNNKEELKKKYSDDETNYFGEYNSIEFDWPDYCGLNTNMVNKLSREHIDAINDNTYLLLSCDELKSSLEYFAQQILQSLTGIDLC